MRMGVMKEYLDLVAHPRIAGAEECEDIKYTKAAKTRAGETPDVLRILWWWTLKGVVRKWRKYDRGRKLEGWDEERTPALSHLI